MTDGLLVFVQLVMAAITTAPSVIVAESPLNFTETGEVGALLPNADPRSFRHCDFMSLSSTRSCGRLGPAIDASTVDRSSVSVLENRGSGDADVRNRPCSL